MPQPPHKLLISENIKKEQHKRATLNHHSITLLSHRLIDFPSVHNANYFIIIRWESNIINKDFWKSSFYGYHSRDNGC